jgi:molecular chaperone Hsp33
MTIHIKKPKTKQSGRVDDDIILPFSLDKSGVRGRTVRLGSVLADIMKRHDYPPPVSSLLSEVVTLALLLSAMLKYDGIFTLQIQGDGPIRLLVADVTGTGEVRAHAGFDPAAVKEHLKHRKSGDQTYYHLLGKKGRMAFTTDPGGEQAQRYQGVVELKGGSITEGVQHYFTQSEQIKTAFKVGVHPQDGLWRTGAVMIQKLPGEKGEDAASLEDWTRAAMFLNSCTEGELVSPVLSSRDILYRLFHEEGVRVYPPRPVAFKCRCTRVRVEEVLRTIPRKEVEDICKKEGHVSITCEFCSEEYKFSEGEMDHIYEEKKT